MSGLRYCGAIAGVAALAAALGGCSAPSVSSWFGSKPPPAAADSNASAVFVPPTNFECPPVVIRQGAGTLSLSADPAAASALNLRYQLGFGDTARECRVVGPMLTMRVGVRGRVIVGPAGGPGQLDVPLRFAVVQEGVEPKVITSKFQRVAVSIPANDPNVTFSHVEDDITFPFPRGGAIDSYVLYVGFDAAEAEEIDKSRKKPARKPPPRPRRANTAQAPAQ
jgi:hypothetical protein